VGALFFFWEEFTMMAKKDYILVANVLRRLFALKETFTTGDILDALADAFRQINPRFNRELWLDYILGKCGPSGGKIK